MQNTGKAYLKALIISSIFWYAFSFSPSRCLADECSINLSDIKSYADFHWPSLDQNYLGWYENEQAASVAASASGWSVYLTLDDYDYYGFPGVYCVATTDGQGHYVDYCFNTSGCTLTGGNISQDSDGDNIPDEFDLNLNSSASYNAAIISVCYDSNNKIVAGVIQDSEGNQYMFGSMPTDMEGYTIESVSGNLVQYQTGESLADSLSKLDINDLNLHEIDSKVEIQDDGTYVPGTSGPLDDWNQKEEDQTKAPTPDVDDAPSTSPETGDSDSEHLKDIVSNTNSTNTNLQNIARYLGIGNDLLAKINNKTGGQSAISGDTGSDLEVPSADDIGKSVKDNLIDPSQTIGNVPNGTETVPDKTDDLNNAKTEFSDRFGEFIDVIKNSDLFSLPFSIFEGPTNSGSSVQTVNIGKWGSSSDQTATIDFSDYDTAWETLRAVLLLLTSFACFKIIVLKKA